MEPLSKIVNSALDEITQGQFSQLPKLGITGLLNDFQYAWLQRLNIPYNFAMMEFARRLCNEQNPKVFKMTGCRSIKAIRNQFAVYIEKYHAQDNRVIITVSFDGTQINAEWIGLAEYMKFKESVTMH